MPATKKIRAFHGDKSVKAKYVNRMKQHVKLDQLVQGQGWTGEKGCHVGCLFHTYDHSRGPVEIGYPEHLMRLSDAIHEGLRLSDAREFSVASLKAAKPGADLSMVWPRVCLWILTDPVNGVRKNTADGSEQQKAIDGVAKLYARWIETGRKPSVNVFEAAARSARSAARSARSAAWSAAESAWSAARSAAWSAARSAWSAARSAESAARENFWRALRDECLKQLRKAPVE